MVLIPTSGVNTTSEVATGDLLTGRQRQDLREMPLSLFVDLSLSSSGHKGCSLSSYKCASGKCVNKVNPECDGVKDCGDGSDEERCGCGTKPKKKSKIVGGSDAQMGAWPWQVSLQMERYGHMCGASLVSSRWLLSAAHCFQDSDTIKYSDVRSWKAYLGMRVLNTVSNAVATRLIRRVVLHPQYDQFTSDYDIALLELSAPVFLSDWVQPVCVPAPSHTFSSSSNCFVTGWGVLMEDARIQEGNVGTNNTMGPKKTPATTEDLEELKFTLNMLTEEVATVNKQQKTIMSLVAEVKALRQQNTEKEKVISSLENRVADLEQYTRINDIIVSGLEIKPRSYAKAVSSTMSGEDASDERDLNSVENQVTTFLESKGIVIDRKNIEACHPLNRKNKNDKPAVIMRFANRKHKMELLKQGRRLKGTQVYLNEHLTKKNGDIARKARFLKKQQKIQSTWTTNCKIFIKLNGTPEQAKVLVIRELQDLDNYE
ncbi:hypothetical protein COCON_G00063930 [Conger conger]|uniref:Peptidase S1 domain-containing protein n=1 Tax=Conger conger TaxID=82655 RepID=A0A9Q1DS06_CONCO|nr:hypothetical protein COCON_G00063930 [Conger conger]